MTAPRPAFNVNSAIMLTPAKLHALSIHAMTLIVRPAPQVQQILATVASRAIMQLQAISVNHAQQQCLIVMFARMQQDL